MNDATPIYYFWNNDRGNVLEAIAIPDIENSLVPENDRQINELLKNLTAAGRKILFNYKLKLRIQLASS